ncbi:MAG: hypothetical protein ABI601_16975 [bacterium]
MTLPAKPTAERRLRGGARVAAVLVWILFLLALGEVAARSYWRIRLGLSLRDTRGRATMFYPELQTALDQSPRHHDSSTNVLLLGGSTLHRDFGSIAQALQERLTTVTRRRVRVFDMAMPAQTSLDSYYKYKALAGVGFDLVIIYDGFNEVRANNVPPELFRDDYSHYSYYELVNDILGAHRLYPFATPYTIEYLLRQVNESRAARAGHPVRVPKHRPDSAWSKFGSTINTAGPFRHNIDAILKMAAARGEPVVLMTFVTYFAPGYTTAAFNARQLDYTTHNTATVLWGEPDNVAKGIAAHNLVIRDLHAAWPATGFVDMATALPQQREYFNDVCHLTVPGSERFVEILMPTVLQKLGIAAP